MKEKFSKFIGYIKKGIAWILAIPMIILGFLILIIGILIGMIDYSVIDYIGMKLRIKNEKEDEALDKKIKELRELKESIKDLQKNSQKKAS